MERCFSQLLRHNGSNGSDNFTGLKTVLLFDSLQQNASLLLRNLFLQALASPRRVVLVSCEPGHQTQWFHQQLSPEHEQRVHLLSFPRRFRRADNAPVHPCSFTLKNSLDSASELLAEILQHTACPSSSAGTADVPPLPGNDECIVFIDGVHSMFLAATGRERTLVTARVCRFLTALSSHVAGVIGVVHTDCLPESTEHATTALDALRHAATCSITLSPAPPGPASHLAPPSFAPLPSQHDAAHKHASGDADTSAALPLPVISRFVCRVARKSSGKLKISNELCSIRQDYSWALTAADASASGGDNEKSLTHNPRKSAAASPALSVSGAHALLASIQQNLSFNVQVSAKQQLARASVPLPYVHQDDLPIFGAPGGANSATAGGALRASDMLDIVDDHDSDEPLDEDLDDDDD